MSDGWQRVSKQRLCVICNHSDWCLYTADGCLAICPRTEEGSRKNILGSGHLHVLKEDDSPRPHPQKRVTPYRVPPERFEQLTVEYQNALNGDATGDKIISLVKDLRIPWGALQEMRVGWDGAAYTFPMSDSHGLTCGIRRRLPSGRKLSVKGGKEGIFVPTSLAKAAPRLLIICEGPTDTAAMRSAGFAALGRPNCIGGLVPLLAVLERYPLCKIAIFADDDYAGRAGAEKLKIGLARGGRFVRVINPHPHKDAREWVYGTVMPHQAIDKLMLGVNRQC